MVGTEDKFNKEMRLFANDALVKMTTGALIGALGCLLFVRRRRWPILLGATYGLAHAAKNCESAISELVCDQKEAEQRRAAEEAAAKKAEEEQAKGKKK
ncbi:uncharacterized protein LOC120350054 [Nilaparvata lugens]|uniref:uncharacterized protein LOC120350054 n=1 Tax=Nilaparvata lugens TaxID=108931 RepID=UPI000B97E556|nr:uncharacterized protein LOC120350054 [Nilaparvata lugens]